MIEITIHNSYSNIYGLSAKQEKELKKMLSYVIGGTSSYFSGYGLKYRSLLDKKGNFPTGLLHRVREYLVLSQYIITDIRKKPTNRLSQQLKTVKPYESQSKALESAIKHHRGIISMPTGTGKSLVIAMLAARLNVKTLIIVPSIEIKKQLTAGLLELKNVTIENIDSTALQSLTGFDCLIIDEAHHAAAKTYQKLNKTGWTGIYYRFFLTATPFRNDTEETLLFESIAGEVIYKLDYKTAISKNYIVPVEAYYLEMPKVKTDAFTWAEVYKELVVENKHRNTQIASLLSKLNSIDKSTLCLVKEVKHGKILSELTGLPFVYGTDEESRDYIQLFNRREITVLIGTIGILGEGIDTKPCEYVIIAGLGKAKSQFLQQVGRAVRKYEGKETAKVILIQDKSHRFCSRHFKEQCAILQSEYGVKPIKLDIA